MPVQELPIFTYYDQQRFIQFSPQDCANWYLTSAPSGKKKQALYPTMGRRHISQANRNVLIFPAPPRRIFDSINFMYVIVGSQVIQIDENFNEYYLVNNDFTRNSGPLFFAYLPVTQTPGVGLPYQRVFCMLTDGRHCYVIDETAHTMTTVTDPNTPINPMAVVAFGNRFAVAAENSTQFNLTQINLGSVFNPLNVFTVAGQAVFAQESGFIRQMGVLHNQLYIFTDFTTGIWSNTPSFIQTATFPWKKNTSYDWNFGIYDPNTLAIGFGMMSWMAQNNDGVVQFMSSEGNMPTKISSQAINVLLQEAANRESSIGFLNTSAVGFLYQYEDTIFYRVTSGVSEVDNDRFINNSFNALEYNFNTQTWHRLIELNGERNFIEYHAFFSGKHIVSVIGERVLYEMAGDFYINEFFKEGSNPQSPDAFVAYPFRYELITPIISQESYAEFNTDWVQIDFVWGDLTFIRRRGPSDNVTFLVAESIEPDSEPVYLTTEDGDTFLVAEDASSDPTPLLNNTTYYDLYKPHLELYYSDDGGISFHSADVREFSQLGIYSWRMRWYELGASRNRCYKFVCVSPSPIVILGAIQNIKNVSGGAY